MNLFNRLLIIIVDLILLAASVLTLLLALGLVRPAQLPLPNDLAYRLATIIETAAASAVAQATVVSVIVALLCLVLLYFELRPTTKSRPKLIVIKRDALGLVTVTLQSVEELASHEVSRLEGVMEASARVFPDREGLRLVCNLSVSPGVNVDQLASQAQAHVQDAVQRYLGRNVKEVVVHAQLAPLEERRRVR